MQTNRVKKAVLLLIMIAGFSVASNAQIDTLIKHLTKINNYYDSVPSLEFDIQFIYQSDTVGGNFENRDYQGTFIMDGNRYYYKMNDTECMQNDSFLVTVMDPERLIMVSSPAPIRSGGIVPLRAQIDSLIAYNFLGYTDTIIKTDSMNTMIFSTTDSSASFKTMKIVYNPIDFSIMRYELGVDYYPEVYDDSDVNGDLQPTGTGAPRKLTLKAYFTGYRIANIGEDMFNIDRYIKEDGGGEWIGVGKYEAFTVSKTYAR